MNVIHQSGMIQPVFPGNTLRFLGELVHLLTYLGAENDLQYNKSV